MSKNPVYCMECETACNEADAFCSACGNTLKANPASDKMSELANAVNNVQGNAASQANGEGMVAVADFTSKLLSERTTKWMILFLVIAGRLVMVITVAVFAVNLFMGVFLGRFYFGLGLILLANYFAAFLGGVLITAVAGMWRSSERIAARLDPSE